VGLGHGGDEQPRGGERHHDRDGGLLPHPRFEQRQGHGRLGGGGELEVSTTAFVSGTPIDITAWTLVAPGA
jgi:hypothetical protein